MPTASAGCAATAAGGRDTLRDALQAAGVETATYYPLPLHLQPALHGRCRVVGDLIEAEAVARTALALPMHPHLGPDDVARVASVIRRVSVEPGDPQARENA